MSIALKSSILCLALLYVSAQPLNEDVNRASPFGVELPKEVVRPETKKRFLPLVMAPVAVPLLANAPAIMNGAQRFVTGPGMPRTMEKIGRTWDKIKGKGRK